MEQIEKALAKAKEMRYGGGAIPLPIREHASSAVNGVTPEYTETFVVAADQVRSQAQRLVADSIDQKASHVYGLLRTQVLQRMRARGFSSLVVTGPALGCGASTTAANLAVAIALDVNQTVLLVDLNLRSPSVSKKFNFEPRAGIDDYLRNQATLKDCLVSPRIPRLVILPARRANSDAAEILSSPRMTALSRELRSRYADRIIIYDAPPLLSSSDTLGFLPNADAVLLVAQSGKTTRQEIEKSAELLNGKVLLGTLMNAHGAA
ncbi:MAG: CpsD/CapB family tyrosine-protein kinase [Rhodospirillaceae bacterium]|nr:CpsD/CapB family tyrosine-protein kinase [Rhodospirillaceae bacterium]